nr:type VII secretion protein EssB/YukC [uncultured Mediterraneibacter sp.]
MKGQQKDRKKQEQQNTAAAGTAERYIRTEVKKSALNARDRYDYEKLCIHRDGLLPCSYEEDREDLYFSYDTRGMKPFNSIKGEAREKKYQLLINFALLGKLLDSYKLSFREDNLYYDENYMLYLKERDIYARGEKPDEARFLAAYKSFVAGVLGSKYSVSQILESGIEICKGEKWFAPVYECATSDEVADVIRSAKTDYEAKKSVQIREVGRKSYLIWRIIAVAATVGFLVCAIWAGWLFARVVPRQENLLAANRAYIQRDYLSCIENLREMEPEDMDSDTLYILAVSYASAESFRRDEMQTIISNLSPNSNPKALEYWIRIGRLETKTAEEIALSLSDDKLLIYAYMKEADDLENDTTIDGETKKERLDRLETEINKLGEKYESDTDGGQGIDE